MVTSRHQQNNALGASQNVDRSFNSCTVLVAQDSTRFDVILRIIEKYDPEARAAKIAAEAKARLSTRTPTRSQTTKTPLQLIPVNAVRASLLACFKYHFA